MTPRACVQMGPPCPPNVHGSSSSSSAEKGNPRTVFSTRKCMPAVETWPSTPNANRAAYGDGWEMLKALSSDCWPRKAGGGRCGGHSPPFIPSLSAHDFKRKIYNIFKQRLLSTYVLGINDRRRKGYKKKYSSSLLHGGHSLAREAWKQVLAPEDGDRTAGSCAGRGLRGFDGS